MPFSSFWAFMALLLGARTLLGAPGISIRSILTSSKKLLGAQGIATRNKKLLGAPGLTTRSKKPKLGLGGSVEIEAVRFVQLSHTTTGRSFAVGTRKMTFQSLPRKSNGILAPLVAMPFAPSSFLLPVAMPGAPSSILAPSCLGFMFACLAILVSFPGLCW